MSEQKNNQLVVVDPEKIKAIDAFAKDNNFAVLTANKGNFEAAIATSNAIEVLREMLSEPVIKSIIGLQGTPLGFRTDKETTGGYKADVIRDVLIDVTIRGGFKPYGNEFNIISSRGYITKEGFQNWFKRQAAEGKCGVVDVKLSAPKVGGGEAIVTASATVMWGKQEVTTGVCEIPVKGSGGDLLLGKATRKILARLFERVSGIPMADGDTSEVTDIKATVVSEATTAAAEAAITDEQKQFLKEELKGHEEKANAWLKANNAIPATGTFLDVKPKMYGRITSDVKKFIAAITAA